MAATSSKEGRENTQLLQFLWYRQAMEKVSESAIFATTKKKKKIRMATRKKKKKQKEKEKINEL